MISPKISLGVNTMSTIRLFDPVYIVPDKSKSNNSLPVDGRNGSSAEPRLVWIQNKPDRIQIDFEKQAWKNLWESTCNHVVNFAEFVFDFGQGAAYSITPQVLVGSGFIQVRNDTNHWSWNLLQAISLVAVGILTVGIGLVALLWVKDYHHEQVIEAESQADQASAIAAIFEDVETLLKKRIEDFGLPEKSLNEVSVQIQNYKEQFIKNRKLNPKTMNDALLVRLRNAILNPLRDKLSLEVCRSVARTYTTATEEQEITLNKAKELQADLQAIEIQINEILSENRTPQAITKSCNEQKPYLNQAKGIYEGVFKKEEDIVPQQAKVLFRKMLINNMGGKRIKVPNNGSCLLLSLICGGNLEIKKDPDMWNALAFELRQRLVGVIRTKIESGDEDLKGKIISEMRDASLIILQTGQPYGGYSENLRLKLTMDGQPNDEFIFSEEPDQGWQAYLKSLEDPATFLGNIELEFLPELVQANILVYKPNLHELKINRDDTQRLHVFSPEFANKNSKNYVYSKQDRDVWMATHQTENGEVNGKILPYQTIPEKDIKNYGKDICVIFRGNHYDLFVPSEDKEQETKET